MINMHSIIGSYNGMNPHWLKCGSGIRNRIQHFKANEDPGVDGREGR
jgi:hypothetical protein